MRREQSRDISNSVPVPIGSIKSATLVNATPKAEMSVVSSADMRGPLEKCIIDHDPGLAKLDF